MALETGNYISDLVAANPPGTDPKSQGDDHLRLIKTAAKNGFPGFPGAIVVTGTDGGAANAYTLTPTNALLAYTSRFTAVFSPTADNTGASTLNISGLGVKDLKSVSGEALLAGELVAGVLYAAFYNGTEFRLLSVSKQFVEQLAFSAALPAQAGNAGKMLTTNGTVASWSDTITVPFTFTSRVDQAKGADIASAATINLSTATGNIVHITGTTTITAITIPSGAERTLVFDAALTLTHNATTLILPSGANITTAAGDVAIVRGDGSGNARVVSYTRASGRSVIPAGWTLLAPPLTPAAAANVDALNIFNSAYDNYVVIGTGIKPAVADFLRLRVAVAGAVDAGSNYYSTGGLESANATSATTSAALGIVTSTVLPAGKGMNFQLHINNVNDTSDLKSGWCVEQYQSDATPTYNSRAQAFVHAPANALTGFRLFWNGGSNFAAAGEIRIYGIINTP